MTTHTAHRKLKKAIATPFMRAYGESLPSSYVVIVSRMCVVTSCNETGDEAGLYNSQYNSR